ncbi:hypothetical protein BZA70DRAFT_266596 [Myxozyma melibiosi]|uniref:Uncharacterized protein n=1 Tax=Myxozyma melibiosi TaxID=54550 RepID=A0ABR1F8V8_9ASCO
MGTPSARDIIHVNRTELGIPRSAASGWRDGKRRKSKEEGTCLRLRAAPNEVLCSPARTQTPCQSMCTVTVLSTTPVTPADLVSLRRSRQRTSFPPFAQQIPDLPAEKTQETAEAASPSRSIPHRSAAVVCTCHSARGYRPTAAARAGLHDTAGSGPGAPSDSGNGGRTIAEHSGATMAGQRTRTVSEREQSARVQSEINADSPASVFVMASLRLAELDSAAMSVIVVDGTSECSKTTEQHVTAPKLEIASLIR